MWIFSFFFSSFSFPHSTSTSSLFFFFGFMGGFSKAFGNQFEKVKSLYFLLKFFIYIEAGFHILLLFIFLKLLSIHFFFFFKDTQEEEFDFQAITKLFEQQKEGGFFCFYNHNCNSFPIFYCFLLLHSRTIWQEYCKIS